MNAAGVDTSRLDLEAKYESVSGDPLPNDRLVATATFTQSIFSGNGVALSVVYASTPEYLGEVDQEFSARAGFKFMVNKKGE